MSRNSLKIMLCAGAISSLAAFPLTTLAAQIINLEQETEFQAFRTIAPLHEVLSLESEKDIKPVTSLKLANGVTKTKYQQLYQGVPVYGQSFVAAKNKREVYSDLSGFIVQDLSSDNLNTSPSLSNEDALQIALNGKGFSQSNSQVEHHNSQLYVYAKNPDQPRLVYEVSYFTHSAEGPTRPFYIIDAHTGEVIEQWEGLNFQKATGPGGNPNTGKYQYGSEYPNLEVDSQCRMSTEYVETQDMGNSQSRGRVHQFNCPENTARESNGGYSPLNDAHHFGHVVFRMYQDWYQTKPLPFKLTMRAHYGRNYDNAFWDGRAMTFGDGGSVFYPLTTLDIAAHEVSHGLTSNNSNLAYRSQSGGINEAFSDMAGETAEYYNFKKVDWIIGAQATKNKRGIRNFKKPSDHRGSIDHAKDYREGMDVHNSSGVYNRAFYNLATTDGWNIKHAFEIFLIANKMYWKSNTNFEQGSCDVMRAAKDKSWSVGDVKAAFKVVGLGNNCNVPDGGDKPDDSSNPNPNPNPNPSPGSDYKVLANAQDACLSASNDTVSAPSCSSTNSAKWLIDDKGLVHPSTAPEKCLLMPSWYNGKNQAKIGNCDAKQLNQRWVLSAGKIKNLAYPTLFITHFEKYGEWVGVWNNQSDWKGQQWNWKNK